MSIKKIILLFGVIVLSSCVGEYTDHLKREFSPLEVRPAQGSVSGELFILPDKKVLENLIKKIETAQERIWIETYTWTEKETMKAVQESYKKGVDVRVILEGNVFRTPWINNEIAELLRNKDIPFSYSDNKRYTFTHIKHWIIDDTWCISTGNWSYSSFTKNREFIYCTEDKQLLLNAEDIFLSDFDHKKVFFSGGLDERIGLAPENIRNWISHHLENAEQNIRVYNQSVTDDAIISILEKKSGQGLQVEVCQSSTEKNDESSPFLERVIYSTSKKPYLHAKVFLIDGKKVILGSANMTKNALENNREILLNLGENQKVYNLIYNLYNNDCKSLNRVAK